MGRLEGKKALITGGTRGIGKAISEIYVENGADVAIFGTNEERGQQVAEELSAKKQNPNQKIIFKKVDVSDHSGVKSGIDAVLDELGQVDILVNCAGVTRDNLLMKMPEVDWDSVININLKSVYNTSHHLIRPMMKKRAGTIINISSVIGLTGNAGQVNYAASKSGMIGLTRSLAKEVASRGITVNCVAPGFIRTDMTDQLTEQQRTAILEKVPLGRLGEPREIALAALFLGSDDAKYISGQVLTVDGGMLA